MPERRSRQQRQPQAGNGGTDADVLEQVTLDHFAANPQDIGPFEWSRLSWRVQAPPGVQLSIDGLMVVSTGEQLVQPLSSHTYSLAARYHSARRDLGTAMVTVHLAACKIKEIPNVHGLVTVGIQQAIAQRKDVTLKTVPQVTITSDTITVDLQLTKSINIAQLHFSFNADVNIRAAFGLAVVAVLPPVVFWRKELAPVNIQINTDVGVPWWVWFIPGAIVALPIALGLANGDAQAAAREIVNGIVKGFNEFPDPQSFANLEPHSVSISPDSGGLIDVLECPPPIIVAQ